MQNISILYEDIHLLACVKPRGILSQTDSRGAPAMPERLAEHCGTAVYPVHRLDGEVSGVMVYAKTKAAAAKLSQLVSDHERFVKTYYAVVEGVPEAEEEVLEDLLFHDRFKNKTYVVDRMRGGVKAAKLTYRVIATEKSGEVPLTLVKIRLYTGRSHQIRVQFASRGMPLAGDKRYGAKTTGNIALFSYSLDFAHPMIRKHIHVQALPSDEEPWTFFETFLQSENS